MLRLIDRAGAALATLSAWMFFAIGGGVPQAFAQQRETACAGRHQVIPAMDSQPGRLRGAICSA